MPAFLIPFLPIIYRWLAIAAIGLALFGVGWLKGAEHGQRRIDGMINKAVLEGVRIVTLRGAVTTKVETKYLPQIIRQQVVTETIVKEVPAYVPTDAPDLPGGFRLLADAAAAGRVPDPAGLADAAPVPAQAAAASVAENYGICRKDQLTLQGLQEWVTEQGRVK